ncbi:biopolymer transporter ExbD [Rubrimonas cliftonensis]|uniref:Outer membrane transport energization protein ExbD n=1 Tax=Rubrimonas cliftonensis TaxID=89524 RepID=A0A1H4DME8_9RHOB|nr:biopolymer transporter ExbD [Rubrimonas cliftonensis]SEA73935.1 outer membrane transport energization protein ExbD [Rubrimonas cliftonensis]
MRRERRRRAGEERLLPLVNVVFLLLLVFLIAGRIAPPQPFAVTPPPTAQDGAREAGPALVAMAADGRLAFEGGEIARADLMAALAARLAETPALEVSLMVDEAADGAALARLAAEMQALGARTLRLGARAAP